MGLNGVKGLGNSLASLPKRRINLSPVDTSNQLVYLHINLPMEMYQMFIQTSATESTNVAHIIRVAIPERIDEDGGISQLRVTDYNGTNYCCTIPNDEVSDGNGLFLLLTDKQWCFVLPGYVDDAVLSILGLKQH